MSQKSLTTSNGVWPWAVGLLIALGLFRPKGFSKSPENQIRQAVKGTRYSPLLPLIVAQAKHETGNFSSNIFREANNAFGMGVPAFRKSLRNGSFTNKKGEVFSKYETVFDSAKDLLLWFDSQKFPVVNPSGNTLDVFEYAAALRNRRYYTDSFENYVNGLRRWL